MATGIVKYFNDDRGFGFIQPDEGGTEIFVHIRSCGGLGKLLADQRVRFREQPSRRQAGKFEAVDVQLT
jgi:cold shock protein